MVSYIHWSVLLWWDPNDVQHRRILPSYEAERWSVPAPLCWWCCYCLADQLWVLIAYARRRSEDGNLPLGSILQTERERERYRLLWLSRLMLSSRFVIRTFLRVPLMYMHSVHCACWCIYCYCTCRVWLHRNRLSIWKLAWRLPRQGRSTGNSSANETKVHWNNFVIFLLLLVLSASYCNVLLFSSLTVNINQQSVTIPVSLWQKDSN